MGGGAIQLLAYGAQDLFLSGNPHITYFKSVYRRYTQFAVEARQQTFNSEPDFGNRVSCTISRSDGDLLSSLWLEVDIPNCGDGTKYWAYGLGNALIDTVEIDIGGQIIDHQYGEWMNIWTELTMDEGLRVGYDDMVGNVCYTTDQKGLPADDSYRIYVPLQFWFCRHIGTALPLIALQQHDVRLFIKFRSLSDLTHTEITSGQTLSVKLYGDFIILDVDERRRFANIAHEYLIDQVQFNGDYTVASGTTDVEHRLNFQHPVKALYWVNQTATHYNGRVLFNYAVASPVNGDIDNDTFTDMKLMIDGDDLFRERRADYFRKVQNYQHHCRIPRTCTYGNYVADKINKSMAQYIYSYSFALKPYEHQPSGAFNFSRVDDVQMKLRYNILEDYHLRVYCINQNILRFSSGLGGLAYTN